jgi:hypothetical protein
MSLPGLNTYQNQVILYGGATGGGCIIGPQGVQGVQGVQGFIGNLGNQGVQGSVGPLGNQGLQGGQGYQGEFGIQGTNGVQGFQGDAGLQGVGVQGFQGVQGNQGRQGFQGNAGSFNFTRGSSVVSGVGVPPLYTITHGLGTTPTTVLLTNGDTAAGSNDAFGVTTITSTTFTCQTTTGSGGLKRINWIAIA